MTQLHQHGLVALQQAHDEEARLGRMQSAAALAQDAYVRARDEAILFHGKGLKEMNAAESVGPNVLVLMCFVICCCSWSNHGTHNDGGNDNDTNRSPSTRHCAPRRTQPTRRGKR